MEAVEWAEELHRGQWRDGDVPVPYLCHPLEVLSLVRYVGKVEDQDLLCAAVLHDVVEETSATVGDVRSRFGEKTASLVEELTRTEPGPDVTDGLTADAVWALRSAMLLSEIAGMSPEAATVKLADRISNLKEARSTKRGKKLARYADQTWRILKIVPKTVNPRLWARLKEEAEQTVKPKDKKARRAVRK